MAAADNASGEAISGIDIEALHEKYLAERDKRLRPEGAAQYIPIELDSRYMQDPFSDFVERPAVTRHVRAFILGGGFGGLIAAALLRKKGIDDFTIVDNAGDFGGTWYWNRYPGARCDIESYIYMPMLEELGYMPTERYARTTEIWEYAKAFGRHFDLYKAALFQTRVKEIRWDEAAQHWLISTDRGDLITAQFVILASGQTFSRPKLPGIAGIESYEGYSFHASRWDYGYTGGNTEGGMAKLRDKRVAVIGTGATAVQAIPHLAEDAQHVYVFQRTPSIVDSRGNRPTDPAWAASLKPGWQQERIRNFDLVLEGRSPHLDLVNDQWSMVWGRPDVEALPDAERAQVMSEYDYAQMERIRHRIEEIVDDPATAQSLKPYYSRFCKRPCYNDEYLWAFNRPNVTLIDTDGSGPDRVSENAIWFDGKAYEVDCIIYATGFETTAKTPTRSGQYNVIGCDGVTLDDKWGGDDEFRSLHGLYANGFPNMYVLGSSRQSASSFNIPHRLYVQAEHVTNLIADLVERGVQSMEVTPEAEKEWDQVVKSARGAGKDTEIQMRECTPSYYNNEGRLDGRTPIIAAGFAAGTQAWCRIVDGWRRDGLEREVYLRRPSS